MWNHKQNVCIPELSNLWLMIMVYCDMGNVPCNHETHMQYWYFIDELLKYFIVLYQCSLLCETVTRSMHIQRRGNSEENVSTFQTDIFVISCCLFSHLQHVFGALKDFSLLVWRGDKVKYNKHWQVSMKRCTRSLKYLREPLLLVVLYMVMINNYHADFCGLVFLMSITTGEPFNLHLDLHIDWNKKKGGEKEGLVVMGRR